MTDKLEKIIKDFEEFFEIKSPDFEIILLNSRDEVDKLKGYKTEPWLAGFVLGNTIYVVSEDKLEEITTHKKDTYWPRLKHELSHLFYFKLTGGEVCPPWLNEGLAHYLAGQPKWKLDDKTKLSVVNYLDSFDVNGYGPSAYWVEKLLDNFGKGKMLELLVLLSPKLTVNKFQRYFKKIYGFEFNEKSLKKIL